MGWCEMEPRELTEAREFLSQFEQNFFDKDTLYNLVNGLDLLDSVVDSERKSDYSRIANNIGDTYQYLRH